MSFNTAYILTTRHGSTDLLRDKIEITLDFDSAGISLPSHYATSVASEDAPLYKFVWREAFGFHLEPANIPASYENKVGPMANGVYAQLNYRVLECLAKSKGLETNQIPELMRVHERFETEEQYRVNSL